jgi:hypothetical protein
MGQPISSGNPVCKCIVFLSIINEINMNQYIPYFPQSDETLLGWATNTKQQAGIVGPLINYAPAKVTEIQDACQVLIEALNKNIAKRTEYEAAVKAKDLAKKEQSVILKGLFRLMKATPGYTEDLGKQMGIVGSSNRVLPEDLRPSIILSIVPTGVSISFNKKGMLAVGIYSRVKGSGDWNYIGCHDSSPFIDTRPLAIAGKPEVREYRAMCRDAVREIGIASASEDIVYSGSQGAAL